MSALLPASAVLLAFVFFVNPSSGAEIVGRVIGVLDGDTVQLLRLDQKQMRIRLSGIDAPEKRQAFGSAAKKALSDLVFSRNVVIEWHRKSDRYGRMIGKIVVDDVDINLKLVQLGMAWHFKKYEREQWAKDRKLYADAERFARVQRVGLWSDVDPTPPWLYRRSSSAQYRRPGPEGAGSVCLARTHRCRKHLAT